MYFLFLTETIFSCNVIDIIKTITIVFLKIENFLIKLLFYFANINLT